MIEASTDTEMVLFVLEGQELMEPCVDVGPLKTLYTCQHGVHILKING